MKTLEPNKNESLVSKRRLGIASVAAFIGCAACCAIPLLAAAGLGSGALATLSSVIQPGSELLIGASVFLGTLAVFALRNRLRPTTQDCSTRCQVDRSCCDKQTA